MFHIPSRSEKSKAALKPQPTLRYHHPDADHADEMEVDTLISPNANPAPNALATQPASPTVQPTPGGTSKALPSGLNFAKAIATGMP